MEKKHPEFLYYATNLCHMEEIVVGERVAAGELYTEEARAWSAARQWDAPVVLKYAFGAWVSDIGDGRWHSDAVPRKSLAAILRCDAKAELRERMLNWLDTYANMDFYQLTNRANELIHELHEMKPVPEGDDPRAWRLSLQKELEKAILFSLARYKMDEMDFLCPECGRLCDIAERYCRKCGRVFQER